MRSPLRPGVVTTLFVLLFPVFLGGCVTIPYPVFESMPQPRMRRVRVVDAQTKQPIQDAQVTCLVRQYVNGVSVPGVWSKHAKPWEDGSDHFSGAASREDAGVSAIPAKPIAPGEFHVPSRIYSMWTTYTWFMGWVFNVRPCHLAYIDVQAPGYRPGIAAIGSAGGKITLDLAVKQEDDGVIVVPMQKTSAPQVTSAPAKGPRVATTLAAAQPAGPNDWIAVLVDAIPAEHLPSPVPIFGEPESKGPRRDEWLKKALLGKTIACESRSPRVVLYRREAELRVGYALLGVSAGGREFEFEVDSQPFRSIDARNNMESEAEELRQELAAYTRFAVSGTVSDVRTFYCDKTGRQVSDRSRDSHLVLLVTLKKITVSWVKEGPADSESSPADSGQRPRTP